MENGFWGIKVWRDVEFKGQQIKFIGGAVPPIKMFLQSNLSCILYSYCYKQYYFLLPKRIISCINVPIMSPFRSM